jgi:hypothetical protein
MHFISLLVLVSTVIANPVAQGTSGNGAKGAKGGESKGKASSGGLGKSKVHLIFARGTTEAGTIGVSVGPALSSAMSLKFGAANFKSEGVPYPADVSGAFSGGLNPKEAQGAKKMAEMARKIYHLVQRLFF